MASKKKQEDKHLSILRELAGQPHNKKCFDCGQRGPTYVNMTIGAFVCTSCSGLLRGLNPPHRIKSISMATFASQEIEFLQNHGNDACRQTWLALWNSELPPEPESRDEQRMRDFLIRKYERKAWYSNQPRTKVTPAPTPEAKPLKQLVYNAPPVVVYSTQASQSSVSEAPPLATLPQRSQPAAPPAVANSLPGPAPITTKPGVDLLSDLGGDPFGPSPASSFNAFSTQAASASQSPSQINQFTDPFGSSPAHSAGPVMNAFGQSTAQQTSTHGFNTFQAQPHQTQFVDPFGSSPAHTATPTFNAFGNTPTANTSSGFDIFGSGSESGALGSKGVGLDAFGTSAAPVSSAPAQFGKFGSDIGHSGEDRYHALSQLDDLFRGSNTQSVFTSGPASSPGSGTGQPNPFMSPSTGTSGAAMLQKQQQKAPNPFQTSAPQSHGSLGNQGNFGQVQQTGNLNAMPGGFGGQGQNLPVSSPGQIGMGQGNFMGGQGNFGGVGMQGQGGFSTNQTPFGGNQSGAFGSTQGFPASQAGFVNSQGGFGTSGFGQPGMIQTSQAFGMQPGFGNQGSFGPASQQNLGGQMGAFQGGSMQAPNQMMRLNQGGGQSFGSVGAGFGQHNAMQQPQPFGNWQQQPQQQAVGAFGGGGGFAGQGGLGGLNMNSQVGMQKATNPFM